MAILWQSTTENDWTPSTLDGAARITGESIEPIAGCAETLSHTLIVPAFGEERATTWLLVTPIASPALVNGTPVTTGIRVLADRDAIQLPGHASAYFSSERLAQVEEYAGEPVTCPRCKHRIVAGDPVVCCPSCNVFHHAPNDGKPSCWQYADSCAALCGQATDLEAGFRWTPEAL